MIYEGPSAILAAAVLKIRSGVAGLIVAMKTESGWARYWAGDGCRCFSEYEAEYPKVFKTVAAANRCRDRLNAGEREKHRTFEGWELPVGEWHVVVWTHPEHYYEPMQVLREAQKQFPGCPTQ